MADDQPKAAETPNLSYIALSPPPCRMFVVEIWPADDGTWRYLDHPVVAVVARADGDGVGYDPVYLHAYDGELLDLTTATPYQARVVVATWPPGEDEARLAAVADAMIRAHPPNSHRPRPRPTDDSGMSKGEDRADRAEPVVAG